VKNALAAHLSLIVQKLYKLARSTTLESSEVSIIGNKHAQLADLNDKSHVRVMCKCNTCGEEFIREVRDVNKPHMCPSFRYNNGVILKFCKSCLKWDELQCFPHNDKKMLGVGDICILCEESNFPSFMGKRCNCNTPVRVECKLIHPDAKLPVRSKQEDAGFDLTSIENKVIKPLSTIGIRTGIIFTAPSGYYFTIEGRSSLFNHGIVPARGIIDSTYCGEMIVALTNNTDTEYNVRKGDRIAQTIIHKVYGIDITNVDEFSPEYNIRGNAGFGSTGR
jgi:dUTP pyrophosphatase